MKCLNFGPCYSKSNKTNLGGIVVLFENWVEFCDSQKEDLIIIDTNKSNYSGKFYAYIKILYQFFTYIRNVDCICLHGTFKDYLFLAPILVFFSRLSGKKIILRKFAGNFDVIYSNSNIFFRSLLHYVLKNATLLFWETKKLVEFGKRINENSYWFPNVRYKQQPKRSFKFSNHFLFLSQVKKEKGIDVLVEAFQKIDSDSHVDIFGPLFNYKYEDLQGKNYSYVKALKPEEVTEVLKQYDVLILPTYWSGEGYPGIIIEALSVGLPVISTNWGGIPEILTDGENGFIVAPKDVDQLVDAIKRMDAVDYKAMSLNALKSFENFDTEKVNKRILSLLKSI